MLFHFVADQFSKYCKPASRSRYKIFFYNQTTFSRMVFCSLFTFIRLNNATKIKIKKEKKINFHVINFLSQFERLNTYELDIAIFIIFFILI